MKKLTEGSSYDLRRKSPSAIPEVTVSDVRALPGPLLGETYHRLKFQVNITSTVINKVALDSS
jgi:hypothetical protein